MEADTVVCETDLPQTGDQTMTTALILIVILPLTVSIINRLGDWLDG